MSTPSSQELRDHSASLIRKVERLSRRILTQDAYERLIDRTHELVDDNTGLELALQHFCDISSETQKDNRHILQSSVLKEYLTEIKAQLTAFETEPELRTIAKNEVMKGLEGFMAVIEKKHHAVCVLCLESLNEEYGETQPKMNGNQHKEQEERTTALQEQIEALKLKNTGLETTIVNLSRIIAGQNEEA